MRRALKKLVFVEPKSTHLHIYSRVCIPRIGSVLLATIMRAKGYDVRVYIEDIQAREAGGIAVLGGTHVSFLPDEGLEHADYVIRGEGEFAFQELVDAIQAGQGFEQIKNLSHIVDGKVVHHPERPKIPNLD